MDNIIEDFYDWAKMNSWNIKKNNHDISLNNYILERYEDFPEQYLKFIEIFKQIMSPSEKTWFLCCDEYNNESDIVFRWNEFEVLSLEAAYDDKEWTEEIKKWWNGKLPIVMSVQDGYSFYAIDLCDDIGSVVRGEEPEFEEVEKVSSSFEEFLQLIITNKFKIY